MSEDRWLPEFTYVPDRECGQVKDGGVYLETKGSPDGVLPMFVEFSTPIPAEPLEFSRMHFFVWGDLLEKLAPYPDYLAGASVERFLKDEQSSPEVRVFGMPMATRKITGVCLSGGLDALLAVRLVDRDLARCSFGTLAGLSLGKHADPEVAVIVRELQDGHPQLALAATWRLWKNTSKQARPKAAPYVRMMMCALNAVEDSFEIVV